MQPTPGQFGGIDVGKIELAVAVRPAGVDLYGGEHGHGAPGVAASAGPIRPASPSRRPAAITVPCTPPWSRPTSPPPWSTRRASTGFRRSEGIQAKTDGLDADVLARFAEQKRPAPTPLPSAARPS